MFQLSADEVLVLRSQSATSNVGRGGRRFRPYAFTEHGAVMLASLLNTPIAVAASPPGRCDWRRRSIVARRPSRRAPHGGFVEVATTPAASVG